MSVLNGERFLREAVDSILSQSFRAFEFIIIDDGSTDGSPSMLDLYERTDTRVRVFHQENRGLVQSLNWGCGLARGKYIARMDADDISMNDRLIWQVDFMEKHPAVGALGGAVEIINAAGESLLTYRYPNEHTEIKRALARGYCPLVHPSVVIRKESFLSVGGYREVVVDAEDYDLWLRIGKRFDLANLAAVVLKYRRHPQQVSVNSCRRQILSNLAARVAASSKADGRPDPLESVVAITPAFLEQLGVSETKQRALLVRACLQSVCSMYEAREYSIARNLINELLNSSEWKHAENWVLAEFRLLSARLCWREGRVTASILSVGYAIVTRPSVLARPLKPLLRLLRLVPDYAHEPVAERHR